MKVTLKDDIHLLGGRIVLKGDTTSEAVGKAVCEYLQIKGLAVVHPEEAKPEEKRPEPVLPVRKPKAPK